MRAARMRMAFYLPYWRGGITAYFHSLRSALRSFGWEVVPVAAGPLAPGAFDTAGAGDRLEWLCHDEHNPARAVRELMAWLVYNRIDVFHTFGSTELGDLAIPHVPRQVRSIVSVHALTGWAVRVAAANREYVNQYVCVVDAQRGRLERQGVPRDAIAVIRHGIPSREFNRGKYKQEPFLKVAYVGALEWHKGADLIPTIAKSLNVPFRWKVVGDGSLEDRLARTVRRSGMTDRVLFAGRVRPEEVVELLQDTDALVVPSRTETFCYALAEGMQAGCAVVASRIAGVTDAVVEDGRTGLLIGIGNARGFAGALEALWHDRGRIRTLGIAAHQAIGSSCSEEVMGRAYAQMLSGMLAAEDRRPQARDITEFRPYRPPRVSVSAVVPTFLKDVIRLLGVRRGHPL